MKVSYPSLTHFILTLVSLIALTSFPAFACSWDYPIWQIRDKTADPYYRFARNGKAGYIDRTGKIVVEPTLYLGSNGGYEFHDGLLLSSSSDGPYVDTTGKVVLNTGLYRNWEFSDGLAAAMRDGENKWGFIDKTGKFVIEPKYESYPRGYVYSFSEGVAVIKVNFRFGFIDRSGEYLVRPSYLYAQSFKEGFARVIADGPCNRLWDFETPCDFGETLGKTTEGQKVPSCKFRFVDKSGSAISSDEFENAKDFSEGLAAVQISGKWGFIDKKGKVVIAPRFGRVSSFSDGFAAVAIGDNWTSLKWGYIDRSGKVIIPIQFEIADDFSDGLAPVAKRVNEKTKGLTRYYVNKSGRQAFGGTFAEASHFFKGVAHVKFINKDDDFYLNGKYAYIDTRGRAIFSYTRGSEDE